MRTARSSDQTSNTMGEKTQMSLMWEKTLLSGQLTWENQSSMDFVACQLYFAISYRLKYEVLVYMWMAALYTALATYLNRRFWKDRTSVSEGQRPVIDTYTDTHACIHKHWEPGSLSLWFLVIILRNARLTKETDQTEVCKGRRR